MLDHLTIEKEKTLKSTKKELFHSLEKQLHIVLNATLPEYLIGSLLEDVYCGVRQELEWNQMKMPQSPWVTMYKEAQAKYLDGFSSILQNLQMPTPLIDALFPGTDKATSIDHIPANRFQSISWSLL